MAMSDEDEWKLMRSPAFDVELQAVKEEGERMLFFSNLRYLAAENGWKSGWAAHFFKSMYGMWPERDRKSVV